MGDIPIIGKWICRWFGHRWIYSAGPWIEYRVCTRCQFRYCESRIRYLEANFVYDAEASICL